MKTESTKRRARRAALFVTAALLAGCGDGGTSTFTPSPGVPASFAISATPSSVTFSANTTVQIQLQLFPISGFSGTASVSISALPAGVTTSRVSPFSLSTAQTLTLTAGAGVTNGTYVLSFNATSGSLSSNTSASLQIEPLAAFSLSSMASNLIVRQGGSTSAIFDIIDSASGYTNFDVGHSELRERVILPEQFTTPGTIAMTMDPAGQNIFLITIAGLTVVTLDAVPLSIGSVTPSAAASGATVTIRGSEFAPTTTVSFGGATSSATFVDEDTLQAVIPGSLPSGALSITVANPGGSTYTLDAALTIE